MDEHRFTGLWTRCISAAQIDPVRVYVKLREFYSQAWRRYHTLSHLRHCLGEFDEVAHLVAEPKEVEMALWFHDAIYEPGAADNEARSVELFDRLAEGGAPPVLSNRVRELIMATCHFEPPAAGDERYMVDIDLASFGLPWRAYLSDSEKVRAEASHLTDEDFYRGQVAFFKRLLSRPHFYGTPFFRRKYEARARENLIRKVSELAERGFS